MGGTGRAEASGEGELQLQGTVQERSTRVSPLPGAQGACGRGVGSGAVEVGWAGSWRTRVPAEKLGPGYTGIGSHGRV